MIQPPERYDPETCANFLRELGASGERILPIAEAALALASFERPRVGPTRYREHLQLLARDVSGHPAAAGDIAERARALNEIVLLKYGYSGDALTYDDLQNANLMRVVDRRKGLPVALGILGRAGRSARTRRQPKACCRAGRAIIPLHATARRGRDPASAWSRPP